jgi:hypothetical protein
MRLGQRNPTGSGVYKRGLETCDIATLHCLGGVPSHDYYRELFVHYRMCEYRDNVFLCTLLTALEHTHDHGNRLTKTLCFEETYTSGL